MRLLGGQRGFVSRRDAMNRVSTPQLQPRICHELRLYRHQIPRHHSYFINPHYSSNFIKMNINVGYPDLAEPKFG